jgi:hypothetical protein
MDPKKTKREKTPRRKQDGSEASPYIMDAVQVHERANYVRDGRPAFGSKKKARTSVADRILPLRGIREATRALGEANSRRGS